MTNSNQPTMVDTPAETTATGGPSESFGDTLSIAGPVAGEAPPQLIPPEEIDITSDEGVTAWLSNKKIVGVWSNASNKNSWINVQGVGWRRLHPANESAVVAMTLLASHARADNRTVAVRVEGDNHVHEIYVW